MPRFTVLAIIVATCVASISERACGQVLVPTGSAERGAEFSTPERTPFEATDTNAGFLDDFGTTASFAADTYRGESDTRKPRSHPGSQACAKCQQKKKQKLVAAAGGAYKDPFYNNSFAYLNDPLYSDSLLGEYFKERPVGDFITFDIGGQYRTRFHSENNMRKLGLTGVDDTFLLHRTRIYTNVRVGDRIRFFGEYIDAVSEFENVAPRPIEENRSDVLNLFIDYKLYENSSGKLSGRVGRQELLYGAQRLISPLDWGNTRRTFQGAKLFWQGKKWNVDGFWTRPVIVNTKNFDSTDHQQEFYGLWGTYKGREKETYDLFWLGRSNYQSLFPAGGSLKFQTVGGRWSSNKGPLKVELQGAYQFGDFAAQSHSAGMYTIGVGHQFESMTWKPTVWGYFDWASGDNTIGNGFDQLFPLAHKYLGFMDFFSRRNIQDLNVLLTADPAERLRLLAWWHAFWLENSNDVPYNVNGSPFTTTPGGDSYLGQELDLLAKIKVSPRMVLLLGYSHFFTGDWYRSNPTPGLFTGDANFYYTQFHVNF